MYKQPLTQSLGYLPDTSVIRRKQGLDVQIISSSCIDSSVCNSENMYPAKQVILNYDKEVKKPLVYQCQ